VKTDAPKVPALRCLRHLIESNIKTHRPRQVVLDLFQPYRLRSRVQELAEESRSLNVVQGAEVLLEVLDRGRDGNVGASAGMR
jgi:hypothetical protein